jgi:hypothetical protein
MATYQIKCTECDETFSTISDMSKLIGNRVCNDCKKNEIKAEMERVEKIKIEFQSWKFEETYRRSKNILKIYFPDEPEDIENTVLKIINKATFKIKRVLKLSDIEYKKRTIRDQKYMSKPFYKEIYFTDVCIEKAEEGILKLRKFDNSTTRQMLVNCSNNLDVLKNISYPKLIEKQNQKRKENLIKVGLFLVLATIFLIAVARYF